MNLTHLKNKIIVIKFGGNAFSPEIAIDFSQKLQILCQNGAKPVIVHGGGPQINEQLAQMNLQPQFVNGLRYTDAATLSVAEMVLSGSVNKEFVRFINQTGLLAVGISGKDGKTLVAKKISKCEAGKPLDLGFVGEITQVNTQLLNILINNQFIPVISPIAYGDQGETLNINADIAASKIAKALNAHSFILMSNISGLLDQDNQLIQHTNEKEVRILIADKIITGGMIPKIQSAIDALSNVYEVKIIDGRHSKNLLSCLNNDNIGTTITK